MMGVRFPFGAPDEENAFKEDIEGILLFYTFYKKYYVVVEADNKLLFYFLSGSLIRFYYRVPIFSIERGNFTDTERNITLPAMVL